MGRWNICRFGLFYSFWSYYYSSLHILQRISATSLYHCTTQTTTQYLTSRCGRMLLRFHYSDQPRPVFSSVSSYGKKTKLSCMFDGTVKYGRCLLKAICRTRILSCPFSQCSFSGSFHAFTATCLYDIVLFLILHLCSTTTSSYPFMHDKYRERISE